LYLCDLAVLKRFPENPHLSVLGRCFQRFRLLLVVSCDSYCFLGFPNCSCWFLRFLLFLVVSCDSYYFLLFPVVSWDSYCSLLFPVIPMVSCFFSEVPSVCRCFLWFLLLRFLLFLVVSCDSYCFPLFPEIHIVPCCFLWLLLFLLVYFCFLRLLVFRVVSR